MQSAKSVEIKPLLEQSKLYHMSSFLITAC